MPDATPLKFTTPENDKKIADFITLTPCSVKLMRESIPAESRIIARERVASDASNYSKCTLDSQASIIDSQSTVIDSQPIDSQGSNNSESQSSVNDSQKTDIQVPQRRSRRSKVVKRLAELDNSSSPSTRRSEQLQNSQSDISQSSQSQQSQGSQAGTPRSKKLKKIIDVTPIEHSALIEMVIDDVNATVRMVKNKSTYVVKCDGVKLIKSTSSRKLSTVAKLKKNSMDDDLCSSQESQNSSKSSQVIDETPSQNENCGEKVAELDNIQSMQSNAGVDIQQALKPKMTPKVAQIIEPSASTLPETSNTTSSSTTCAETSFTPTPGESSRKNASSSENTSKDIPKTPASDNTQQDEEELFDSISTHDSFFDDDASAVETLEVDQIMNSTNTKDGGSLQFSSVESEVISAASSQDAVTPLPPRLAASTPSESSLTADSAKSADSVDVVSSKDTDKPNLNTVAGKPDSNAEERVKDYETENLETKSNAGLLSAQSNVPESTNRLTNGIDTPVRPERNTQKNKFGVSPSPSRMQVLSPSRAQVSCLSGFISFYVWWFIPRSLHN